MIEILSQEQMQRSIENARKAKLTVRLTSIFRMYRVENRETGAVYVINFYKRNGRRFGECSCKAGQNLRPCKHLAASLGLHMAIAAARKSH